MTDITRDRVGGIGRDNVSIPSQKEMDAIITTSNDDGADLFDDDILRNVPPTKSLICLMIGISTT